MKCVGGVWLRSSGRDETSRKGAKTQRMAENQIARRLGERSGRGKTSREGAKTQRILERIEGEENG